MTQQQWTAPRPAPTTGAPRGPWGPPQAAWGAQSRWGAPTQSPWPAPVPTPPPPRRRGGGPLLRLLAVTLAVAAIMVGIRVLVRPTTDSATTSYANESYRVPAATRSMPDVPEPRTFTEAHTLLERNAFYDQPVAVPVRCDAQDLDLTAATDAQLQTHLNDLVECLMRTWGPAVKKAGYELPRPTVTIYGSPIQTACGKVPLGNAVWCGADQQIYYANNLADQMPSDIRGKRWTVEAVVAHEFGHHLQGRTGIFMAGIAMRSSSASDEAKRYSRRIELQADCFSGAFLHSVAQSRRMSQTDLDVIKGMFFGFGDNRRDPAKVGDHGSQLSRQYWAEMGLAASKVGACNTFVAPTNVVR